MTILCDGEIIQNCSSKGKDLRNMIMPFIPEKVEEKGNPSYGLSSYGYDIRLGHKFIKLRYPGEMEFPNVIDPANSLHEIEKEEFSVEEFHIIFPGEFILAHSLEYFNMPINVTGLVKDKSTYARCGIALQNTVLEAGWCGQITLEISNHGPRPVKLRCGTGIAQVLFFRGEFCLNPYDGKYQGDTGVVTAKGEDDGE